MSRSARDTVVLLPTYNERRTLCALTEQILALTTADICVIDDNSPDGTGRLACELAARESRIHVLQRPKKMALERPIKKAFDLRWNGTTNESFRWTLTSATSLARCLI